MNRLFSIFFGCLFTFSITLTGQDTSCFTFESPELTGQYGIATGLLPGDLAFWLGDWPVSLDLIHYPNGNEGFMNLTIDDNIFGNLPPLTGQSVFMGNLSMTLDFSAFNGTVSEVCFDYFDGGGVENLSVNGQPVVIVEHLTELPEDIAPGVTLTLITNSNTGQSGTVCVAGNIESLSIGGQEFGLDNLCVTTSPASCEIWDLVATPQPCTPNGIFFVDLSFQFAHVGNEGYTIQGNGNNYGNFSYDDPFPVLGPFQGDGQTVYEFAVIDLAHPDCDAATFIDPVDCFPACELSGLTAYVNTCGIQNAPYLYIDFDHANVQNVGFDLFFNNEFFGFYSYEDLPLQLYDYPPAEELIVQVCENDNDNCCANTLVYTIPCEDINCITFNELENGVQYGANQGNMAGDTVLVAGDVAVTLDSFFYFDGTTGFWGITVADQSFNNFDLAEGNHLFVSNINLDFDFSAVPGEVVSVCFDFFDGGGEENIAVNGQLVEVVSFLTDVPYEIAPGITFSLALVPSGSDFLQTGTACLTGPIESLTIGGQEFGLDNVCYTTFTPNADCQLFDLIAETYACENGTFLVDVAFGHENTGPDGFQVIVNNEVYGPFSYEEMFVTLGPFAGDGVTVYDFLVIDIADPSCYAYQESGPISCAGSCEVWDLAVEVLECDNENNTFSILLDFNYTNPNNAFFDFFVANEFFGYFELDALPLVIEGIPPANTGEMTLKVCINDQPDCCQTIVIATPDCAGPVVWPGDANSDNLAHHFDLLNLGIAYGAQGPDRSSLSIEWDGMPAENWGTAFADGVDYAHADCNGDGVVDALDRVAIIENYGLTHGPVDPYVPPVPTEDDPSVFVDFPNTDVLPGGASFEAPVVLGAPGNPVENLYGIAFAVVFDPEVIDPESVTVSYPASWFGSPNLNVLTIDRSFAADGRIEVALTRIDQEEISGYGVLCLVGGIIDDIAAMVTSEIHVAEVKAIRYDETPIPLRTPETTFQVVAKTNAAHDLPEAGLNVYPNPTRSWITIDLPDGQVPERVMLQDAMGQRVALDSPDHRRYSLEGLPAGVYWLQIRWRDRTVIRKIVKLTD